MSKFVKKKDGKFSKRAEEMYAAIDEMFKEAIARGLPEIHVHGKRVIGNWRRYQYLSTAEYDYAHDMLHAMCVPHYLGNDAPRGGRTGDYIAVRATPVMHMLFLVMRNYMEVRHAVD
jgi:hypothetical protein